MAVWVRARQGEDALPVRLERRRLYILPTRGGVAFGALVFAMLIAGLNYANSLALFLTFLLAAFALVAMQLCHRNLLGLTVHSLAAPAVFAQRPASVMVSLENPQALPRPQLGAALDTLAESRIDLTAHERRTLVLALPPLARGLYRIGRLRLAGTHPFGLFRAWTWLHHPLELIVYPAPAGSLPMPGASGRQPGPHPRGGAGVDEWLGLRPFRDGDSPRQVDWKAYAREAPLLVKEYQPAGSDLRLFDFSQLPMKDTEARLAQLARWIVDAEAQGERYGLMLPGEQIAPDRGPEHRHRCLARLAQFGGTPVPWPR